MATTTTNKGFPRRRWTRELARAIGWAPLKLRGFLRNGGVVPPYDDNPRKAIKMLVKAGISVDAYLEKEGEKAPKSLAKEPPTPPMEAAPPSKEKKARLLKPRQLTKALSLLLPEGDTPKGRRRVRLLLEAHGVRLPCTEDAALAALTKAGIQTERYHRLLPVNGSGGGNGSALVLAGSKAMALNTPAPHQEAVAVITVEDERRLHRVRIILEQHEGNVIRRIKDGSVSRLNSWVLDPVQALNEMREK